MTVWVLVVFVAFGEYSIPGIESREACLALNQQINPDYRGQCYPYRAAVVFTPQELEE